MTIPEPNTKELPGPFDAFATAKPGEPIITFQGGDRFAAQTVRHWVEMVREHALYHEPDEAKARALLIKASSAEAVSFQMDAYREGHGEVADSRASYNDTPPDEAAKALQDRHKVLVAAVQRLDNATAEANEAAEVLRGFDMHDVAGIVQAGADTLRAGSARARPARPAYMTPGGR